MPYILPEQRIIVDPLIEELAEKILSIGSVPGLYAGVLNYTCTRLILELTKDKKFSYGHLALITGVLDNIKTEFYRRKGVPYEDTKILDNGDLDW